MIRNPVQCISVKQGLRLPNTFAKTLVKVDLLLVEICIRIMINSNNKSSMSSSSSSNSNIVVVKALSSSSVVKVVVVAHVCASRLKSLRFEKWLKTD